MRIWFDLSNSPHINMFHDLIRDLESDGHEVIITSIETQNSSVTVYKLDVENLDIFYANGILTHNQKITAV